MIYISTGDESNLNSAHSRMPEPTLYDFYILGNTSIWYSKEYSVTKDQNSFQLFHGSARRLGKEITGLENIIGNRLELLESLVGPFFYIEIDCKGVKICSSLCRYIDFFFRQIGIGFVISTNMKELLNLHGRHLSIDKYYCQEFLIGNDCYNGKTAYDGLHHLVLGGFYTFTTGGWRRNFLDPGSTISADEPLKEALSKNIKTVSKKSDQVYLNFSGGLDSSILFASMVDAKIDFTPLHLLPMEDEDNSEVSIAEDFCKSLGKKLEKKHARGSVNLNQKLSEDVNLVMDVPFFSHEDEIDNGLSGSIITGIGGDAVFLQNPPSIVSSRSLRKLKIRRAFSRIMDLAELKKTSFPKLFLENIFSALGVPGRSSGNLGKPKWIKSNLKRLKQESHPLLAGYSKTDAKYFHMLDIISNIYSFRQGIKINSARGYSPILFQNIVARARLLDCEDSYTHSLDRVWARQELHNIHPSPICHRSQKKPATDLYFNVLNQNAKIFESRLMNSRLIEFIGLDRSILKESIKSNTTIKIDSELTYLERLYQLDIYLQHCPDECFEVDPQ